MIDTHVHRGMDWNVFIMVDWAFWKILTRAGLRIRILVSKETTFPWNVHTLRITSRAPSVTMCKEINLRVGVQVLVKRGQEGRRKILKGKRLNPRI
jgi:hypothetical protein